jgi:hypothetical protein
MKHTKEIYQIPDYYLGYLYNADATNLTDSEHEEIIEFEKDLLEYYDAKYIIYGNYSEPYFAHNNDINNIGSTVCDVEIILQY